MWKRNIKEPAWRKAVKSNYLHFALTFINIVGTLEIRAVDDLWVWWKPIFNTKKILTENPKRYVLDFTYYVHQIYTLWFPSQGTSIESLFWNKLSSKSLYLLRVLPLNHCSEINSKCLGINFKLYMLNPDLK